MKSFFALAALVVGAVAQRARIVEPTAGSTIAAGSQFTVEVHQDNSLSDLQQVNIVIAINPCYDVCDDPSQWGLATVLYNGAFNPQYNSSQPPQKGLYQDFIFTLPEYWPTGGNVINVAHLVNTGAVRTPSFEYTNVQVNVA